MSGLPNPYRDAFPWGTMIIGGIKFPGIIESIDGCSKPETWIYQRGLASSQAVSIWRGTNLAETITVVSRVWNEATFDACYALRDALKPSGSRRPPVLPVLNGQMNFARIQRVSVKDIIPPLFASGNSWTFKTILTEYNPMKPVPVGPADVKKPDSENEKKRLRNVELRKKAAKFPL